MAPVGLYAQLACIWEATARKPGNVHRYADFADLTYLDLVQSAAAIAPVLTCASLSGVGKIVLEAVKATRRVAPTNTNLGIILLLAALAAERDLIARQYVDGFREIFADGVPALCRGLEQTGSLENAIIYGHLHLLASHPDSLIARKRGLAEAEEASRRARSVLERGWP